MAKYLMMPVEVDAVRWCGDNQQQIKDLFLDFYYDNYEFYSENIRIGGQIARINDYILIEDKYPKVLPSDVFKNLYREVING